MDSSSEFAFSRFLLEDPFLFVSGLGASGVSAFSGFLLEDLFLFASGVPAFIVVILENPFLFVSGFGARGISPELFFEFPFLLVSELCFVVDRVSDSRVGFEHTSEVSEGILTTRFEMVE